MRATSNCLRYSLSPRTQSTSKMHRIKIEHLSAWSLESQYFCVSSNYGVVLAVDARTMAVQPQKWAVLIVMAEWGTVKNTDIQGGHLQAHDNNILLALSLHRTEGHFPSTHRYVRTLLRLLRCHPSPPSSIKLKAHTKPHHHHHLGRWMDAATTTKTHCNKATVEILLAAINNDNNNIITFIY